VDVDQQPFGQFDESFPRSVVGRLVSVKTADVDLDPACVAIVEPLLFLWYALTEFLVAAIPM